MKTTSRRTMSTSNNRKRKTDEAISSSTATEPSSKRRKFDGSSNADDSEEIMDLSKFGQKNTEINVSNITSSSIFSSYKNNEFFSRLDKLIKATNCPELQSVLSVISALYKLAIGDIDKEIKIQKRIIQTGITNIDEQIFALSQQEKQLKIEMSTFNKDGNNKIDELSSHKLFIDKLLIKYKQSIAIYA